MTVRSSRGEYEVAMTQMAHVCSDLRPIDRVIVDENVARLWPSTIGAAEQAFKVPAGESSKSLVQFGRVCSWLASSGANRKSRLFAIGGGVVGDLAGFVAASYMRGIELVMVPTTLLAMVDSSVGGKVAIDIEEGKNLVGAFWPPSSVRIAVEFLQSLPDREFLCGSAEVWKYGYILDPVLVSELESQPLRLDERTERIIGRCVELKSQVVEQDEEERTGLRAVLNFGHTVGHAVEAALGYAAWTHGEAISVGMVVESRLGELLGVTPKGTAERVVAGLASQGLPTVVPTGLDPSRLIPFAKRDKKSDENGLAFSLLTGIGECKLVTGVAESTLLAALEEK